MSQRLALALANLERVTLQAAALVSLPLMQSATEYDEAIRRLDQEEPGGLAALTALAASLSNRGKLRSGEVVLVVHEGRLVRARVLSVVAGGSDSSASDGHSMYQLSLWTEVAQQGAVYEAGFETAAPLLQTRARRELYLKGKSARQELSHSAKFAAERRATSKQLPSLDDEISERAHTVGKLPSPETAEFLLLLYADQTKPNQTEPNHQTKTTPNQTKPIPLCRYADAERTLPQLQALAKDVQRRLRSECQPIVAPLKGEARAMAKVLDKYKGNYARLTDLARMTFECRTFAACRGVLEHISAHEDFELLHVKDRMMHAFDARATGGYRDLLCNVRCLKTGHISHDLL